MLFDIFYENGFFYTTLKGMPDPTSAKSFLKRLLSYDEWSHSSKVISDERYLDFKKSTNDDIRVLSSICSDFKKDIGSSTIAVYVNTDFAFGMRRMLQSYSESYWNATVNIFKSYNEAKDWLNQY